MNKIPFYIILPVCFCLFIQTLSCSDTSGLTSSPPSNPFDSLLTPISEINAAFANHDSGTIVTIKGTVTTILSDDTDGDRHQRFIVRLSNNQTLLIVHNIDIAPRVADIEVGSVVYVRGEYIWNDQGGLVHWTHRDPDGVHENGWIISGDVKYQ